MNKLTSTLTKTLATTLAATLLVAAPAFAANDPGSFGRSMKYLDVSSQLYSGIWYATNATECGATEKCVQITDTSVLTQITEPNITRIDLPAFASNSLLCQSISPSVWVLFYNTQSTKSQAALSLRLDSTIQSTVLNNPSLINRVTGQPFNGKIEAQGTVLVSETNPLQPFDSASRNISFTRHCVGGLLSVKSLQDTYGLTASQARSVFANPMTVTLSAVGRVRSVDQVYFNVAFRLYGD